MKVIVDQDLCISCGLCITTCEEVFSWNDDDKADAIEGEVPADFEDATQESVDGCPTDAIKKV